MKIRDPLWEETSLYLLEACLFAFLYLAPACQAEEPVRIGILQSEEQETIVPLLMEKLETDSNVILVQREWTEKPVHLTPEEMTKAGKKLGVDAAILLTRIPSREGTPLYLRLVGMESGAILCSFLGSTAPADREESARTIVARIKDALPKLKRKPEEATKVSLVNFRAIRGPQNRRSPLAALVTACLSETPRLCVLERQQLQKVRQEKALRGSESPFWTANYVIQGTVEPGFNDPKSLLLKIEVIQAGRSQGEVIEVKGELGKPMTLARAAAEAIAKYIPPETGGDSISWERDAEALLFLRDADLSYCECKDAAANAGVSAATGLGLKNARLAELRYLLALLPFTTQYDNAEQNSRSAHENDSEYERLRPFLQLAGTWSLDPRYYRGENDFWFPEGLDQIDELITAYRGFAEYFQTDPAQRKIHEKAMCASVTLMNASWPHLLIYREFEADKHKARTGKMAQELSLLCDDILKLELTPKERFDVLTIRAAMIPFWAMEKGNLAETIRKTLAESRGLDRFADRAYIQEGLMAAVFLAQQYAIYSDLGAVFAGMKDELLASDSPADRVFGKYVEYYTTDIPWEDFDRRRQVISELFQEMEALPLIAERAPSALDRYCTSVRQLFEKDPWTRGKIKVPEPENNVYRNEEMEPLTESLERQLRWKFKLYALEHWPEDPHSKISISSVGYGRNGVAIQNKDEVELYLKPVLQLYQIEKAKEAPNQAKLKVLTNAHASIQRIWPDLVQEVLGDSSPAVTESSPAVQKTAEDAPKLPAHRKWSLRDQTGLFDSGESPILVSMSGTGNRRRLLVRDSHLEYLLVELNLAEFTTSAIPLPADLLPERGNDHQFPRYNSIENERWLYLFSENSKLLKYDMGNGTWKILPIVSIRTAAQLGEDFYFWTDKEIYRIRPETDALEVLVSVERTPAQSPLDNRPGTTIRAHINEKEGLLLAAAMAKEGGQKPGWYSYSPQTSTWQEASKASSTAGMPGVPPDAKCTAFFQPDGRLLFSHEILSREDLMQVHRASRMPPGMPPRPGPSLDLKPAKGNLIPIAFEGEEEQQKTPTPPFPSRMLGRPMQIRQADDGLYFISTSAGSPLGERRDPVTIWFVSFAEIDAYLKARSQ